jgi:nucleoside-diphosphate-sugar epimerase
MQIFLQTECTFIPALRFFLFSPLHVSHYSNFYLQDLALAHILAATIPEASGKRFIICEGQVSSQEISDILRKNIPELEERTPIGIPGGNELDENAYTCSSELAEKVLGIKFTSKEETFVELARQLLEIEREEKA